MELIAGLFRMIIYELTWLAVEKALFGIRALIGLALETFADWRNARRLRRDKLKKETEGKAGHVLGIRHPDKH